MLTIWYNTRCPVCDAGIVRQKRRLVEAIKA
ncbi:MAG: thiol-disulfide oxidoreductase, partial [Mesorhizobium sp.]